MAELATFKINSTKSSAEQPVSPCIIHVGLLVVAAAAGTWRGGRDAASSGRNSQLRRRPWPFGAAAAAGEEEDGDDGANWIRRSRGTGREGELRGRRGDAF